MKLPSQIDAAVVDEGDEEDEGDDVCDDDISEEESACCEQWLNILAFTSLSTFAAGWINVLYYMRYKCFVTMITGNTLWLGASVVDKSGTFQHPLFYLSLIASFYAGSLLVSIFRYTFGWSPIARVGTFTFIYAVYIIVDLVDGDVRTEGDSGKWKACLLSSMFGIYATMLLKGGLSKYPEVAMSGNAVNLSDLVVKSAAKGCSREAVHSVLTLLCNIFTMILGALLSSLLDSWRNNKAKVHLRANGTALWLDLSTGSFPAMVIYAGLMCWNDYIFKKEKSERANCDCWRSEPLSDE